MAIKTGNSVVMGTLLPKLTDGAGLEFAGWNTGRPEARWFESISPATEHSQKVRRRVWDAEIGEVMTNAERRLWFAENSGPDAIIISTERRIACGLPLSEKRHKSGRPIQEVYMIEEKIIEIDLTLDAGGMKMVRTVGQFCEIVKRMRQKQKAYFRAGAWSLEKEKYLKESKDLEREVDEWLAFRDDSIARKQQPELGM